MRRGSHWDEAGCLVGGSAAFTQSQAAKKRAVAEGLKRRHMVRGIFGKPE